MLLTVIDLHKEYRPARDVSVHALRGISFAVELGEIVAITGPSGCGKSTLLNLIGGMDAPSRGKVMFRDTDIGELNDKDRAAYRNKSIGYIVQDFALIEPLTVRENLEIPMLVSNRIKRMNSNIELCLSSVSMTDYQNRKVNTLSGGQKQRVAIARALIMEPEIILADEPTGSLDSNTSLQILELLKALRNQKRTILIVTHNMEIAFHCDRIVSMRDGVMSADC